MVSVVVSFVLSFFPRGVLDGILGLVGSVSGDFPSYSYVVCYYELRLPRLFFFTENTLTVLMWIQNNWNHKKIC